MSVTFTLGGTTYTVKSPYFPYMPVHDRMQVKGKTAGGTQIVQELAAAQDSYTFQFKNMTTAERDNLESFYKNTVDGAMTTFTFTDVAAAAHTARWMDDTFNFQMDSQGRWSGTVTLQYE